MGRYSAAVTGVALAMILASAAGAQAPPQPPPAPHHSPGKRTLPTPPNAAVNKGLSLENECLNAIQATRNMPKMKEMDHRVPAGIAADEHLNNAEQEAHAGRGQACEDEVTSAEGNLQE